MIMWHLILILIALYACIQFPLILLIAAIIVSIFSFMKWRENKPKPIEEEKISTNNEKGPITEGSTMSSAKDGVKKDSTSKVVRPNSPPPTLKPKQVNRDIEELYPECEFVFEDRSACNFDIPE